VPSYFDQPTTATQPSRPFESSAVAIDMSMPTQGQPLATAAAMALHLHMDTQSATVHVATPTCTQPLNPSGLSTIGVPALKHVNVRPTHLPTTHDLVDLTPHSDTTLLIVVCTQCIHPLSLQYIVYYC